MAPSRAYDRDVDRYSYYDHDHGGHPLAWVIFAPLLLVLLLLVVWLVQQLTRERGREPFGPPPWPFSTHRVPPAHLEEPLSVLRLRYARGEISREEFLQASADLGGAGGPAPEPPP